MHTRLKSRVARIEKAIPRLRAPKVADHSAALLIASQLAALGIERGSNESLAETTARAMGISLRELRAELWRCAGGS
jgi:hypothetical protein